MKSARQPHAKWVNKWQLLFVLLFFFTSTPCTLTGRKFTASNKKKHFARRQSFSSPIYLTCHPPTQTRLGFATCWTNPKRTLFFAFSSFVTWIRKVKYILLNFTQHKATQVTVLQLNELCDMTLLLRFKYWVNFIFNKSGWLKSKSFCYLY